MAKKADNDQIILLALNEGMRDMLIGISVGPHYDNWSKSIETLLHN